MNKMIVIGSTETVEQTLSLDEVIKLDKSRGHNIINCHYIINKDGEIINTLLHYIECGTGSSVVNKKIFIRYVGGIENNEYCDTRTQEQKYSIYALLYSLNKDGYNLIIGEDEINQKANPGFNVREEVKNIEVLWKQSDICISKFKELKKDINFFKNESNKLINKGIYSTKEEVLNSKYAKIYNLGLLKFNDIIERHFKNTEELVEIDSEFYNLNGYEIDFPKKVYDKIIEVCDEFDFQHIFFIITCIYENYGMFFFSKEWIKIIEDKYYTHPIFIFHAWSLIKKSYPVSVTTKILKKYENIENLTKNELKEYLLAYMLLYEEAKSIHDFNSKTLWRDLYELIIRGDYICGKNHVSNGYQINMKNVLMFLTKKEDVDIKKNN